MQAAKLRAPLASVARRCMMVTHPALLPRTAGVTRATASPAAASTSLLGSWKPGAAIRMLYDGECALCMKEVGFLRSRDTAGRIDFVDIADPSYDAATNAGVTFEQAMERIHAILPDGSIIRDVEVFRHLYEAVGLGWVYAITRYAPVLDAANALYGVWAKYRTQITGREALSVILERRRAEQQGRGGSLCRDVDGSGPACEIPAESKV